MAKGPAPRWNARKEPVLDAHLAASINNAGGKHNPETGWYATLHLTGMKNRDEAKEVVRALYRSARHLGVSLAQEIVPDGNGYRVEFAAINKAHARAYVAKKYGTKPPYNPHARNS